MIYAKQRLARIVRSLMTNTYRGSMAAFFGVIYSLVAVFAFMYGIDTGKTAPFIGAIFFAGLAAYMFYSSKSWFSRQ
jgi:hypothetical protein